jgi:2,4-didehydro-3-deoxy-L-rhamnonate hydrolase
VKICRFAHGGFGVVDVQAGLIHDVTAVVSQHLPAARYPLPTHDILIGSLDALTRAFHAAIGAVHTRALAGAEFLAPIANPGKLIGAPVNYQDHLTESQASDGIRQGRDISQARIGTWGLFLKANSSLMGPSQGVAIREPYHDRENRNDFEVELACIIGKSGTRIPRADAMGYVAAYTIGLDMTLRGPHTETFRKSIDTYAVLGPWIVTADELGDPAVLDLKLWQNGQLRQSDNTRNLIYDIPKLIEWASSFYTLHPGDVIFTGTPAGVAPVKPGDVLLCEVERIGQMTVGVRAG